MTVYVDGKRQPTVWISVPFVGHVRNALTHQCALRIFTPYTQRNEDRQMAQANRTIQRGQVTQYAPDMEPNMHLYQIFDGEIEMVVNAAPETNGTERILALADSPASALWAATLYDRGELQPDNHVWNGETIVALRYDGKDDPKSCLSRAEDAWGGPVAASRHLGVAYTTWAGYKSGVRAMPEYIRRSIIAHLSACP